MKPYYQDATVTLWHGANLEVLPQIGAGSIDCVVTSPPYFNLRDYGVDGQYGSEETPAEFVANLVATFAEIRRVLADDGTVWLNLGDSYATSQSSDNRTAEQRSSSSTLGPKRDGLGGKNAAHKSVSFKPRKIQAGLPSKNLLGMPWRTAFALQDDGWILRNAIVWHKPNAMPESVTDRLSTRYEMLFMFSESRKYWFDLDPIREPVEYPGSGVQPVVISPDATPYNGMPPQLGRGRTGKQRTYVGSELGRNPGDVWSIPTTPFHQSHFAVFPPEIPRRCVLAGCKPGGTVLDPFHGSGTTGMVAQRLGRKYVGIELNQEYIDLSLRTRLKDGALPFDSEAS